jgi:hypothetical protein
VLRLRSDLWVSALLRRAQGEGAFVAVRRKGADQAGAIYIVVNCLDGRHDLYSPAPQMAFDDATPPDRLFSPLLSGAEAADVDQRLEQEISFDPDCWIVEIEDRHGRPFADIMKDPDTGRGNGPAF